jgi:hypothetical protein
MEIKCKNPNLETDHVSVNCVLCYSLEYHRHNSFGSTIVMDTLLSVLQHRFSSAADHFDPAALYTNLNQTYFELYL